MTVNLEISEDDLIVAKRELRRTFIDSRTPVWEVVYQNIFRKFLKLLVEALNGLTGNLLDKIGIQIKVMGLVGLEVEQTATKDTPEVKELQQRLYKIDAPAITRFTKDIEQGKKSPAQVNAIASQYERGLKKWTEGAKKRTEMRKKHKRVYAFRSLGTAEHCPVCPRLAYRVDIAARVPLITEGNCPCRGNCQCSIHFFPTFEEAFKAVNKMKK